MYSANLTFQVITVATGQPATGLAASSNYSSIKIYQDGSVGADIHTTAQIVEDGGGWYHVVATDLTALAEAKLIIAMASATYSVAPTVF